MSEIVILTLLVFIGVQEWQHRKDMRSMIRAVLSRNVREFANAEQTPQADTKDPVEEQPEFIPLDQVDDTEFTKAISRELN